MKILKHDHGSRDQGPSPFSGILVRLCEASGALGAALVDGEGETVDYAGRVDTYDLRVAAAEWRLALSVLEDVATHPNRAWASSSELLVRAAGRSFAVAALTEGYALVLVLPRHSFRLSRRALAQTADELELEAGLLRRGPRERLRWSRVEVQTSARDLRRPEAVWYESAWRPVSILGKMKRQDLEAHELGYMARLASGRELLLVREPLGKWFAADPV